MEPSSKEPVSYIRLHRKDRQVAMRLARSRGLPLSTWMRMVIMERLTAEVEKERAAK